MLTKKKFHLLKGVYLVKGAVRAALYDTNNGDILSIDKTAKSCLESILEGKTPEETAKVSQVRAEELLTWLNQLEINNLGRFYEDENIPDNRLPEKPEKKLNFIWFELTQDCNLRCIHCYNNSNPSSKKGEKKLDELMFHEDWLRLIDEAADLKVEAIQFIGGEPFLYKHIFELVKHAKSRNIGFIEIFTNGTLVDPGIIKKIAGYNVHVALSFYGPTAEVHDRITQKKGSFEKTVNAIKILQERKVPIRIACTAMNLNEGYINETMGYIKREFGIENIRYDIVRPIGRGCNSELVPQNLYEKHMIQEASFPKVDIKTFAKRLYGNPCLSGKLCINQQGDVYPCIMEKGYIIGHIKKTSLRKILESERLNYIWDLSKDQIDGCKICEYLYACSDCRPKSKVNGNFLAKPKECLYDPHQGIWMSPKNSIMLQECQKT